MQTATYRAELSARLRQVTDDIAWVVRGTIEDQAHYKPADYEWSMHEHLSHLRDPFASGVRVPEPGRVAYLTAQYAF